MANIEFTVQDIKRSSNGVNITDNDTSINTADTYFFLNNGRCFLLVNNGTASPCTVTVVSQQTVDSLAVTDLTATVAAGKEHIIGPFPTAVYNNSDGKVQVTFDQAVTAIVLRG